MILQLLTRLKQVVCAIQGHPEEPYVFERGRVSRRCIYCGYESPGWDLKQNAA
jgi:hypothetical protein